MSFNVGDVVRLKSGGPGMVVSTVSGNTYTCVWFTSTSDKILEHDFKEWLLEWAHEEANPQSPSYIPDDDIPF